MFRQTGKSIAVLMLILVSLSCARLPDPGPKESDGLEVLPGVTPVPAAWGNLISVTGKGTFYFQLWFEDEQGAVRMVKYDVRNQSLLPEVDLFPRH